MSALRREPRLALRRAVSLVEVLVVALLLGVTLVTVLGLGTATHRQTSFTEYHLLAAGRARMIMELAASLDFEVFAALPGAGGGAAVPVKLESLYVPGAVDALYAATAGPSSQVYEVKLPAFRHAVDYTRIGARSGLLHVAVTWNFPGDRGTVDHRFELTRLIQRREVGVTRVHERN